MVASSSEYEHVSQLKFDTMHQTTSILTIKLHEQEEMIHILFQQLGIA